MPNHDSPPHRPGLLKSLPVIAAVVLSFACSERLDAGPGCERGVHLVFQAEPLGSSPVPFDGVVGEITVSVPAGEPVGRRTVAAAIASELDPGGAGTGLCQCPGLCEPCTGLQGWAIAVAVEGDLTLVDAGIEAANPRLICGPGFFVTEILDPEQPGGDGEAQGQAVASAVAFFCAVHTTLYPWGTESVLAMTLEAEPPRGAERVSATLRPSDDLRLPGGIPALNLVTLAGLAQPFCSTGDLTVHFTGPPRPFRRCDPDDDGRLGIADAIAILRWIFAAGTAPPCEATADCNGDRAVNVTDAVHALLFNFRGASPPPAPFPDCGLSDDPSESCPEENACPAA